MIDAAMQEIKVLQVSSGSGLEPVVAFVDLEVAWIARVELWRAVSGAAFGLIVAELDEAAAEAGGR